MDCACAHDWEILTQPWTKLLTLPEKAVSPIPGLAKPGAGYNQPSHPTESNRPSGLLESDSVQDLPYEVRAHAAGVCQTGLGSELGEAEEGSWMLLRACAETCQISSRTGQLLQLSACRRPHQRLLHPSRCQR
eukprot:1198037-Amphidinium_carterae.1